MMLLKRMGILAKLLAAAVPLLLVLMGVSLYSSLSMSQLGASLGVVNQAWRDVNAATELENGVLLPHLGSATLETRTAMATLAARNVAAVLAGEPPLTPVVAPARPG